MKKESPSIDQWLKEAKAHESAPKIGMYLTHNGTVRQTAKAKVRFGEENTKGLFAINYRIVDENFSIFHYFDYLLLLFEK